jgi:hypothetical protein
MPQFGVPMTDEEKLWVQSIATRVQMLEEEIAEMKTKTRGGPKSDQPMKEVHAFRVKFGDLKDASHKEAADKLGLSYGQVFSCRGGYTFKGVRANWVPKMESDKPDVV